MANLSMIGMMSYKRDLGDWTILVDLVYLEEKAEGGSSTTLPIGDGVTVEAGAKLKIQSLVGGLYGGYVFSRSGESRHEFIVGARYFSMATDLELDADISLQKASISFSPSTDLWDGVVGVEGRFSLGGHWRLPYHLDVGAGSSKITYQALVGVIYGFRWINLSLSYRYLYYDEGDDGLVKDTSLTDAVYAGQEIPDLDATGLREWIIKQPCCVTNADGTKKGDPLNLVVIGTNEAVWPAFLRVGWDPTAAMSMGSAFKTGVKGVFGGRWRNSPISSLYVFGRRQDISLQKVRSTILYRNHLRLWLAPVTFRGLPVWLGQISRDIGSRFTTKSSTLTTHRIDPNVDETRAFLVQDFLYSEALKAIAACPGVGAAPPDAPRHNLTGDPYFTDGIRAVFLLTDEPTDFVDVEWFDWTEGVWDQYQVR